MSTDNSLYKILLVDDEQDILDFLSYNLKKEGYQVFTALNGKDAISLAKKEIPHLIVLDVMMPEMDGIETCREIREIKSLKEVMVAFLSARNEDYSQIAGFEVGADDYINKPIKPRVFVSRIKALLRRYAPEQQQTAQIDLGGIRIDKEKHMVYKLDQEVVLPKKEFKLLSLLASKPGKVFTREFILEQVWGDEVVVGDRTIGIGYKFEF